MPFRILLLLLFIALGLNSCNKGKSANNITEDSKLQQQPSPVMVTTALAVTKTFHHELLCNGTLEAASNARVGFEV